MKQRRWASIACVMVLLWQASAMAQPRVLEPGVEWLPGSFQPSAQPDGNSVLIEAPDGWIVVDSGRHPAHSIASVPAASPCARSSTRIGTSITSAATACCARRIRRRA
jgi:hypothetical protein